MRLAEREEHPLPVSRVMGGSVVAVRSEVAEWTRVEMKRGSRERRQRAGEIVENRTPRGDACAAQGVGGASPGGGGKGPREVAGKQPRRAAESSRLWRKNNPDKTRAATLRRHGVLPEQYALMLAAQGGACAICRHAPADGKVLNVDHNHSTGKIRALLCTGCNVRVGKLEHPLTDATMAYIAAHG